MATAPAAVAEATTTPIVASASYRTYAPAHGGCPAGIHHSRDSPMVWSIRSPPALGAPPSAAPSGARPRADPTRSASGR